MSETETLQKLRKLIEQLANLPRSPGGSNLRGMVQRSEQAVAFADHIEIH